VDDSLPDLRMPGWSLFCVKVGYPKQVFSVESSLVDLAHATADKITLQRENYGASLLNNRNDPRSLSVRLRFCGASTRIFSGFGKLAP
jgi:hypothetical protein